MMDAFPPFPLSTVAANTLVLIPSTITIAISRAKIFFIFFMIVFLSVRCPFRTSVLFLQPKQGFSFLLFRPQPVCIRAVPPAARQIFHRDSHTFRCLLRFQSSALVFSSRSEAYVLTSFLLRLILKQYTKAAPSISAMPLNV